MSDMHERRLIEIQEALPGIECQLTLQHGEINLKINANDWFQVAVALRDQPHLHFEQLIDLCGMDWSEYAGHEVDAPRYGIVVHLLSIKNNMRIRLKAFCQDNDYPMMQSLVEVWPNANWYEREAFDVMGIVFDGHPDLRRILTDYGFVGHPFRKDFPISGHVEMRYDAEQQRVIYQPVSIEPRNNVPRIVREEHYGDTQV
jgi:NADH-quinone oxidoreductase subunit C